MSESLQYSAGSEPGKGNFSRRDTSAVAVASIVAAASTFIVIFIATRTLQPEEGTEFLAFWSLLFGLFGVISGIQNETTRAVGAVEQGREPGIRVVIPALIIGALVAVLVLIFSPLMRIYIAPISGHAILPSLVVEVIAYSAYVTLVGSLSGHGFWGHYAGLISGEVVLRMLLMAAVLAAGANLIRFEVAAITATAVLFIFLLCSNKSRRAFFSRADAGFAAMVRMNLLAVLSTTCTAILVTAYGAVLKALTHNADPLLLGGIILAVSLTRAPIMMPLTSFTSVAIKIFLEHRDAPMRAVAKPTQILMALGLVGGAAAWFVGPWVVRIFNPGYHVSGWVFAALTFSSAFMAILTLLGTLVLALDSHVLYAAGWLVASAVAIAFLLTNIYLPDRVVLSLFCGPSFGAAVMLIGLLIGVRKRKKAGVAG